MVEGSCIREMYKVSAKQQGRFDWETPQVGEIIDSIGNHFEMTKAIASCP